jgi:NAD(P)-dependent dehydrogenase (short-subunit alcohol dehydrogenase family)
VELEEKIALVTGGGAGIGRATALRLAREGTIVAVADVDEDTGSSTVREIQSQGGRAAFVLADVASDADVSRMVAFAGKELGGLDVLVNNAGGVEEPYFREGNPEH